VIVTTLGLSRSPYFVVAAPHSFAAAGGVSLLGWFVISRPVPEATVREFAKECPHYVAKSFKDVGHACGEWGR
jgi:hypothetical protein